MFYTVYKITNMIDGKLYIGKHQTKNLNDDYMGSGKHLKRAITKHGLVNFKKEILFQFDNEADMNAKEAELVTEDFCLREDTYNICVGGQGGFSYINAQGLSVRNINYSNSKMLSEIANTRKKELNSNPEWRAAYSANMSKSLKEKPSYGFAGKSHTSDWKQKHSSLMKKKSQGSNNSQFGTVWITNGLTNKKIKADETIPDGWIKGRHVSK